MKFFAARVTKSFRRGSALLLALVLTMALFIMGLVFVSTTQTEKETVSRVDELQTLDTAVDTVIGRINTVLVDDLIYKGPIGDEMLDGTGDSQGINEKNEYYDYPGPDDPWLASLEPYEYGAGTGDYRWRRISDIYNEGINNVSGSPLYDPVDRNNPDQWDSGQAAISNYYMLDIGTSGARARIVADIEGTETIVDGGSWDDPDDVMLWGARADADGDGVADSRWVKVPNLTGPRGQNVYTAVRIIDNGGMLNLNTGLTFDPAASNGFCLTDINLADVCRSGGSNPDSPGALLLYRCTFISPPDPLPPISMPTTPNRSDYNNEVSKRTLNPLEPSAVPGVAYNLYDITDELELRNRFFIDSQVISRAEYLWPKTFSRPGNNLTRTLPYNDPLLDLPRWFQKAYFDTLVPDLYTRRHICTTYSFDRVMVPKPNNWDTDMPADLKTAWETWTDWDDTDNKKWSYRPVCVNDYVSGSTDPCIANLEQIAAAIWLGLPDGSVIKDLPQFYNMSWSDAECRERLACQMAVNMVDYRDADTTATEFNPGGTNYYYGYEYNGENPYISMIAVALYDNDISTPPSPEETHYAVEIYNPGPAQIDLSHFTLKVTEDTTEITTLYKLPAETVNAQSSIVLVNSTAGNGFTLGGVVDIDHATFAFTSNDSLKLIDNTNNDAVHDYIEDIGTVPVQVSNGLEEHEAKRSRLDVIDGGTNFKFPIWPEGLGVFADVTGSGLTLYIGGTAVNKVPIQLAGNVPSQTMSFKTIGELFNVLSIGTMDIGGTCHTIPEFWDHFYQSGAGDPCDVAAGRIDMSDPCFADFPMRYFSVFNPFNDTVDNDGDGKTDTKNELAVAGRININTAPWLVIAQLPWVSDPTATTLNKSKLARAIVAYRDMAMDPAGEINYSVQNTNPKWNGALWVLADAGNANKPRKFGMGLQDGDPDVREEMGFANIAELLNVTHNLNSGPGSITYSDQEYYDIRRYGRNGNNDNASGNPPFYSSDVANDDLLERDIIFQRISNLITVRSDVFTAYIMVRVGELGPQKRVIAIFDRSNVYNSGDTPKLVALHPVPDPR